MEKIVYFTHYFHLYVSCCLRTGSLGSGGSRLIGCEARTGQSSGRLINAALPMLRVDTGSSSASQVVRHTGPAAAPGKFPGQLASSSSQTHRTPSFSSAAAVVYGAGALVGGDVCLQSAVGDVHSTAGAPWGWERWVGWVAAMSALLGSAGMQQS